MRFRLLVFAVLIVSSSAAKASSRAVKEHGAQIFTQSGCAHCHSIRNVGGKKGPDLSGVGRKLKKPQISQQIVAGSKQMPPFGEDLQGKDLADLVAYLHSCRAKK